MGILAPATAEVAKRFWLGTLRARLEVLGWTEGQNLVIESAFANYQLERLPALAQELVGKQVDVIWALAPEAAIAAARMTRAIPIVFSNVSWPVEQGLVESFARPGRNVTGVASYAGIEVSTKRLEFLRAIAPAATRLSWILGSVTEPTVDGAGFDVRPLLEPAARRLGFEVRYHAVQKADDLDRVLADILASRAQAVAVAGTATLYLVRERIAAFALSNRLPTASAASSFVEAGGLLSYNAAGAITVSIPRSVEYVDRILRGARPADLPVDIPEKYELIVNLKTARALELKIPQSVLLRTDRVIEQ